MLGLMILCHKIFLLCQGRSRMTVHQRCSLDRQKTCGFLLLSLAKEKSVPTTWNGFKKADFPWRKGRMLPNASSVDRLFFTFSRSSGIEIRIIIPRSKVLGLSSLYSRLITGRSRSRIKFGQNGLFFTSDWSLRGGLLRGVIKISCKEESREVVTKAHFTE